MEYWPHVDCKYTIFYDCCVCGLSCNCGLNCKTAIRGNATAAIAETMCYLNRKIEQPDLGIANFRVAINLHFTTTISYSMHTAVRNSSFSKLLALLQSFTSRFTLKAE